MHVTLSIDSWERILLGVSFDPVIYTVAVSSPLIFTANEMLSLFPRIIKRSACSSSNALHLGNAGVPGIQRNARSFSRTFSAQGKTPSPPSPTKLSRLVQSVSPLAPIGVNAALAFQAQTPLPVDLSPKPKIFSEFSLTDRVGIVSGGNRGLGLEMALALCEAGARAIYCLDLSPTPSEEWEATRAFVESMDRGEGVEKGRLEYVHADVRDQMEIWLKVADIAENEGRMDICVAAAGILRSHTDCLEYPAEQFKEVRW